MGYLCDDFDFLLVCYYDNIENNYVIYVQVNFFIEIGDMLLDGEVGVCVVKLEFELNGNSIIDGVVMLIMVDISLMQVLLVVNMCLQVVDEVFFCVVYGKIINCLNFVDLNLSVIYFLFLEIGMLGYGNGGNLELDVVEL